MDRDIESIIEQVQSSHPDVRAEQLKVKHAADDDGLWFFTHPKCRFEVQLESTQGTCPFLVESNEHEKRVSAQTVNEAIAVLAQWLHL